MNPWHVDVDRMRTAPPATQPTTVCRVPARYAALRTGSISGAGLENSIASSSTEP